MVDLLVLLSRILNCGLAKSQVRKTQKSPPKVLALGANLLHILLSPGVSTGFVGMGSRPPMTGREGMDRSLFVYAFDLWA